MTDQEWSTCDDLKKMVACLRGTISERKNRLFNVACCRRIWHLYRRPAVQAAILVGERHADGKASDEELREALRTIHKERARVLPYSAHGAAVQAAGFTVAQHNAKWPLQAAHDMRIAGALTADEPERGAVREREERACRDLVCEIFSNPFRRVSLVHSWLSENVRNLALAIYEGHSFEDMPILADALEDAGCREPRVLDHCRKPLVGSSAADTVGHFRGCWVLDLLLARD
jgi:hypothetical protein